ncbi:MAG TPA: hypothetical protein PLB32_25200, partial [Acidobacteriota bacterium]|nr:hypothetical protein [Acidobacteriota bacterium]
VILGAFLTMQDYAQEHLQDSLPQLRIHPWRALAAILLLIVFTLPLVETSVKNTWQALMIPPATPYRVQRPFRTPTSVTLPPLGWWKGIIEINALLKKLPSNLVLACSEYGYIGSEHPALPIIDLVGLHDRKVAYAGFSARSVLAQKPDIIWFPHTDYTFEITEIIDNEDFRNSYEFYPKVYNYGIAVRKDSSEKAIIQKELTNEFERVYPGYLLSDFKAEPIGVPHPPISAPVNPDQSTPGASPEQQSGN